jgi:hypothetical protein
MAYTNILSLVDHGQMTAEQKAELQKVLKNRKRELEKALGDVDAAINKLNPTARKSTTRKRP